MPKLRVVARFCWRTVLWVIILAASAAVVSAVIVPRLFGATPYTIITGSMQPQLPAGTVVIVRPIDPASISVGDVITVQLESGKDTVVTHRVYQIGYQLNGEMQFITKGDANDLPDDEPRLPVQIRGEVWYHIPYLGYVSSAFTGSQRYALMILAAIGLGAYAAWMFTSAAVERKKMAAEGDKPDAKPEEDGEAKASPEVSLV